MSGQVKEASAQYSVSCHSREGGNPIEMGMSPGYKQTEVGVIPADWNVTCIGDFAPLQRGFDLPNRDRVSGVYPVVYSNGIVNFHNKYQVKGPGVVTGRSGTIGKVHYVDSNYWPHNTALWVTKFNNAYPKYVYYLYNNVGFSRFSSGSGVPTLNRNDAHLFKLAVPNSIDEQTAIAIALSDVDALITSLEKLIAKKRVIKTAAMQQLLTGKKRLPPFDKTHTGYKQTELGEIPVDWKVVSIDKAITEKIILDQMDGNHGELYPKSHEFSDSGVPYVGATDFDNGVVNFKSCKYLPVKRANLFKKGVAKKGDVLFAHNATVGPVALLETDFEFVILSTTATYYRCNEQYLNNAYLKAYFESESFIRQYTSVMSQSTRNQVPILAQRKFLLFIPCIKEQNVIANLLSDMNKEIEVLEKRLNKTQQLKQGMMQELLTGRTRLV